MKKLLLLSVVFFGLAQTVMSSSYTYDDVLNLPPTPVIKIQNDLGSPEQNAGTTETTFSFNGSGSYDDETSTSNLEVRFDFENDGVLDTYFSKRKSAKHKYETTGIKTIRMEVLDLQGNVASGYTQVLIVNNTPPVAHFNVEPKSGTSGTIFKVNTGHSEDSQYMKYKLEYRFDWNSDGKFDTHFERKTSWNHRYSTTGVKNIIMEVRDNEGASDTYKKQVEVIPNTPPTASLNIETISVNEKLARIKLDASESKDTQDSKIKYKWDYNYTGNAQSTP